MSLSNNEKMDILLQQLEMPEEVVDGPLKNSELHKVIVMKSKQIWHFYIRVERTLPFDIYHLLVEKLKTKFKHIAHLKLTIQTENQMHNEKELVYYLKYFTSHLFYLMPMHVYLKETPPFIDEHSITFYVTSEAEVVSLKRKLEDKFHYFCEVSGLKRYA